MLILLVFAFVSLPAFSYERIKASSFDSLAKEQYKKVNNKNLSGEIPAEFDWKKTPPQDLTNIFTKVLKESLAIEKEYSVKIDFYSMPVNKQCEAFAYFTAKSVYQKEIKINTQDYILIGMYIVQATGKRNYHTPGSSLAFLQNTGVDLITAEGSNFFVDEDGKRHIPWSRHAVVLFVVQSAKDGNIYYIITDPFLYKRSVGLLEWVKRYHVAMTDFQVTLFNRNPKLEMKRISKNETFAAKTEKLIKQLAENIPADISIRR